MIAIKKKWSFYTNSPIYVTAKRKKIIDLTELISAISLLIIGLIIIFVSFNPQYISSLPTPIV